MSQKTKPLNHATLSITLILVASIVSTEAAYLQVTSDQPAILDSNVTFVARFNPSDHFFSYFDIYWVENPFGRQLTAKLNKDNNFTSTWSLSYSSKAYKPGTYAVTTTVQSVVFRHEIAVQVTTYNITENFTGSIIINQPGVPRVDPDDVSSKNETELAVNLHDPSKFIDEASNITWSWYNQTSFIANTTTPKLKLNLTQEGENYVNVSLTAFYNLKMENKTETIVKHGFFETNVTVKVPILNFTMRGEAWIPHGRLLNLSISCDGTGPYSYCWWIQTGSHNKTGNETCESADASTTCSFDIQGRYFPNPGLYTLFIVMSNDVSNMVNRTMINVYKVPRKQPLSIIVVPIGCSIIAVVIIIFGVAYFWENHSRYTVEVADFDFGQNDELPYMTFFERLRDALSTGTNPPRLLLPDDEPMLS